jgi:glycosyltransferase involved in cell wall biosynthesis
MRIAVFIPSLMPGGVQRVMLNLTRGMAERGCTVDLLLARAEGPFLKEVSPGVRIVDLRASGVLASLPRLVRFLRSAKPDALLSAQPHCNLVAIWARRMGNPRTRLVISEHGYTSQALRNSRKLIDRFIPMLMHWFYPRADAVVAVSRDTAGDLAARSGLPRENIHVIHNPVLTPEIKSLSRVPVNHRWMEAGQPPLILSAGRLHPAKDFVTLIQAFAAIIKWRQAHLIILGEGEQRQELERLVEKFGIRDHVEMPGFTDNPFAYMAHCAVFVLASRWEGFGNVLVEALACGAQVVSTDCPGGPAEILENGKSGRLAMVGNVDSLSEAIETALDHPLPVENLRKRAQAFSMDAAAEKYLNLLGMETAK